MKTLSTLIITNLFFFSCTNFKKVTPSALGKWKMVDKTIEGDILTVEFKKDSIVWNTESHPNITFPYQFIDSGFVQTKEIEPIGKIKDTINYQLKAIDTLIIQLQQKGTKQNKLFIRTK